MKYIPTILAVLFLIVLAPHAAQASSILNNKKDVIGTILEVEGRATVNKQKASVKTPVHRGDVIATGLKSRVYILLMDNTELTLAENGQLKLDDYVFNPNDSSDNRAVYSVIKGAFMYVSGLVAKRPNPDVKINIPQGSIGIRGTKFWTGEKNGSYGVVVGEGEVEVKTKRGKVRLRKGQGTALRKTLEGAVPTPVTEWNKQDIQAAVQTVTFKEPQAIAARMEEEKKLIQPLLREQHMEVQREIIAEIRQEVLAQNPELAKVVTIEDIKELRREIGDAPESAAKDIIKQHVFEKKKEIEDVLGTEDAKQLLDEAAQAVDGMSPAELQQQIQALDPALLPAATDEKSLREIIEEQKKLRKEKKAIEKEAERVIERIERQEEQTEKRNEQREDKAEEKLGKLEEKAEIRAQKQEEQREKRDEQRADKAEEKADKAEEKAELRVQRQEAQNEKREQKRQKNKKDDGEGE